MEKAKVGTYFFAPRLSTWAVYFKETANSARLVEWCNSPKEALNSAWTRNGWALPTTYAVWMW